MSPQPNHGEASPRQHTVLHSTEIGSRYNTTTLQTLDEPFASPVPNEMNQDVERWLAYFTGSGYRRMQQYLHRSGRYAPLMTKILKEEGVPEDLVYVVFVESGFNSQARSPAAAVGYWQFIRRTGQYYGLRIDRHLDERRDPELSTQAAAKYFKSLYSLFGSWYLSLAAYNAGENRIKSLVMKHHTRNFWELARMRKLPRETMNYVPQYLAARRIAKDPLTYGFDVQYASPLAFTKVPLSHPISNIRVFCDELGISRKEFRALNPAILGSYVPINHRTDPFVRVPIDTKNKQELVQAALLRSRSDKRGLGTSSSLLYRVRRGDTLFDIARRYRVSLSSLRRANGLDLKRATRLHVGQKLVVPTHTSVKSKSGLLLARVSPKSRFSTFSHRSTTEGSYHVVRRGDTLVHIARRYRVPLRQLARANEISNRSLLRIGQRLVIPN